MFQITDAADLHFIFSSISNGWATKLDNQSFRDGAEDEYFIDFYSLADAVFRVEYNDRTASTVVHEIDEENKERLLA